MFNSPATDLAAHLASEGYGAVGTKIFVGQMPDGTGAPDEVIALYDTAEAAGDPKYARDVDGLMVHVRGAKTSGAYDTAYDLAMQIREELLHFPATVFSDLTIVAIEPSTGVYFLGFDDNNRPKFTVNFRVTRDITDPALTNREML